MVRDHAFARRADLIEGGPLLLGIDQSLHAEQPDDADGLLRELGRMDVRRALDRVR